MRVFIGDPAAGASRAAARSEDAPQEMLSD
jgi:hypothetical protein